MIDHPKDDPPRVNGHEPTEDKPPQLRTSKWTFGIPPLPMVNNHLNNCEDFPWFGFHHFGLLWRSVELPYLPRMTSPPFCSAELRCTLRRRRPTSLCLQNRPVKRAGFCCTTRGLDSWSWKQPGQPNSQGCPKTVTWELKMNHGSKKDSASKITSHTCPNSTLGVNRKFQGEVFGAVSFLFELSKSLVC